MMCWMDSRRLLTGERNLITKIGINDLSKGKKCTIQNEYVRGRRRRRRSHTYSH